MKANAKRLPPKNVRLWGSNIKALERPAKYDINCSELVNEALTDSLPKLAERKIREKISQMKALLAEA